MDKRFLAALVAVAVLGACSKPSGDDPAAQAGAHRNAAQDRDANSMNRITRSNPLLEDWQTQFGAPPFDQFEDEDFLPALRAGMRAQKDEIAAISGADAEPDFDNTLLALERSGALLRRARSVFFALNSAHSNDSLREVARTVAPELAAHADDLRLDQALFARLDSLYKARDSLGLNPEQLRLLEETHKDFVRAGVALAPEVQDKLRAINARLAELSQRYGDNLLKETNAFELLVTDKNDLGNLPDSLHAAARSEAQRRGHECECWVFTLQRPSINPFLEYSPNRELRRKLFEGYVSRGANGNEQDNRSIASQMADLRSERAALMGYPTHAHYVLTDNMAQTPERVQALLGQVWPAGLASAKTERDKLTDLLVADGEKGPLQGWDWRYYTEKLRKLRYNLDAEALRPYFEVNAVRDGVFDLCRALFGIRFEARPELPRWHPDQQAFEVLEADGQHIGVVYLDFFARESKRGGAWMNELRAQSRLDGDTRPIVTTNFNFPPPGPDSPSLLSLSEARTLFHEFGHAIHGLLSDVTYLSLAGTRVPRDFVEFPSQVLENWMGEPEIMRRFAKHFQTGETIPDALLEKIGASATFNQGFATVELTAAALLDLDWHLLEKPGKHDAAAFEAASMQRIGLIDAIAPRYGSSYFGHIFSGGYAAGYYSYLWSEVLDADAFAAFREAGLLDPETAGRYRKFILSQGNSRPGMELYEAFRGRAPEIGPFLQRRGLAR